MIILRVVYFTEECPSANTMSVDITPEIAAELVWLIDTITFENPSRVYGRIVGKVFSDNSPIFYDADMGELSEMNTRGMYLHITKDSVYWTCYEKHTEDGIYESQEITRETLQKIVNGETLDPAELDDTKGDGDA